MCDDLVHIDGQKFACNRCNDCINARKNTWVARAMAEKLTSKETFAITLTYNNKTQENRDGATAFEYRHIKNWIKRLRAAIQYKTGQQGGIRYLVAGEKGTLRGRVHWHVVLFCSSDVLDVGEFSCFHTGKLVTERADKISEGEERKRLNWSMWPHGYVLFQEPDQGGIEYALKYALKDQYNSVAAAGTMRETKVGHVAAGMFRMSKVPPIGFDWLVTRLHTLLHQGAVPVSLNIPVPGYSGYWYPTRQQREYLIDRIRLNNELIKAERGRNAPQWAALVASIEDESKDLERLIYGTEKEEGFEELEDWERSILHRSREFRQEQTDRDTRRRCGGLAPCQRCINSLGAKGYREATREIETAARAAGGFDQGDARRRRENRCNKWCAFSEYKETKRAFSGNPTKTGA